MSSEISPITLVATEFAFATDNLCVIAMLNRTVATKGEIRRLLAEHHGFGECLLENVWWRHQGATLDLVFNYVWRGIAQPDPARPNRFLDGEIRSDLERPQLKTLRFHVVQEYHIQNALNDLACENVYELGEAFSEVAVVRLEEDDQMLRKYESLATPFHHVACRWEGDRQIDIVFAELEVFDVE